MDGERIFVVKRDGDWHGGDGVEFVRSRDELPRPAPGEDGEDGGREGGEGGEGGGSTRVHAHVQRYCEPLVQMLLALMAVRAHTTQLPGRIGRGLSIARWLGPAALASLFALGTAASIVRSPAATPEQLAAPGIAVEVSPVSSDP